MIIPSENVIEFNFCDIIHQGLKLIYLPIFRTNDKTRLNQLQSHST